LLKKLKTKKGSSNSSFSLYQVPVYYHHYAKVELKFGKVWGWGVIVEKIEDQKRKQQ